MTQTPEPGFFASDGYADALRLLSERGIIDQRRPFWFNEEYWNLHGDVPVYEPRIYTPPDAFLDRIVTLTEEQKGKRGLKTFIDHHLYQPLKNDAKGVHYTSFDLAFPLKDGPILALSFLATARPFAPREFGLKEDPLSGTESNNALFQSYLSSDEREPFSPHIFGLANSYDQKHKVWFFHDLYHEGPSIDTVAQTAFRGALQETLDALASREHEQYAAIALRDPHLSIQSRLRGVLRDLIDKKAILPTKEYGNFPIGSKTSASEWSLSRFQDDLAKGRFNCVKKRELNGCLLEEIAFTDLPAAYDRLAKGTGPGPLISAYPVTIKNFYDEKRPLTLPVAVGTKPPAEILRHGADAVPAGLSLYAYGLFVDHKLHGEHSALVFIPFSDKKLATGLAALIAQETSIPTRPVYQTTGDRPDNGLALLGMQWD